MSRKRQGEIFMAWVKTQRGNKVLDCIAFRLKKLNGSGKTILEGLLPRREHYHVLGEFDNYKQAKRVFLELSRHVEAKDIAMFEMA